MGSISHHITPLVINILGGGHTRKHPRLILRTEAILRNQALRPARAWFKKAKESHCDPELGLLEFLETHRSLV